MKVVKWFLVLVLFTAAVVIAVQNTKTLSTPVEFRIDLPWLIDWSWKTVPIPLGVLLVFAVLFGGVFTGLAALLDIWRLRGQVREGKARIATLERETVSYRRRAVSEAERDDDREGD